MNILVDRWYIVTSAELMPVRESVSQAAAYELLRGMAAEGQHEVCSGIRLLNQEKVPVKTIVTPQLLKEAPFQYSAQLHFKVVNAVGERITEGTAKDVSATTEAGCRIALQAGLPGFLKTYFPGAEVRGMEKYARTTRGGLRKL